MNTTPRDPSGRPSSDPQRDELLDNERRAQPENFKPEAVEDKVVDFDPRGPEGVAPIQGLDPDEPSDRDDTAGRPARRPGDRPA